jgi:hypothetical protein
MLPCVAPPAHKCDGYSVFIIQGKKIGKEWKEYEERLLLHACRPEQKNGYERKHAKGASMERGENV